MAGHRHPLPETTDAVYHRCRQAGRVIRFITIRAKVLQEDRLNCPGGFILAPTHISHTEPFILSMLIRRHIDWMTRIEFYRRWWNRRVLNQIGAFPVRRFGVPISAVRTAIDRLQQGRIVGIFPEGGVAHGDQSVCRGGPIKRGACLVAYRANVPVVPCVIVGTHDLNRVGPWLPWGRAKLWIAYGEPTYPDLQQPPKLARAAMAATLEHQYQSLFRELVETFELDETTIP